MALNIGNKVYRNLQEQVGYNSEQIDKIFSILDGIDYEDHVVVIEDLSTPLTEEEMAIVAEPVAFLVYQDKLYFKDSSDSEKIYFSAVINIVGTDVITISEFQISVNIADGVLAQLNSTLNIYSETKVNDLISNIGNASPKGVYATLADLQTAYPTGAEGIYVVTADGHWYYWDGLAWTDGGTYQATQIANESIDNKHLSSNLRLETILNNINYAVKPIDTLTVTYGVSTYENLLDTMVGNIKVSFDAVCSGDIGMLHISGVNIMVRDVKQRFSVTISGFNNNSLFFRGYSNGVTFDVSNINVSYSTDNVDKFSILYDIENNQRNIGEISNSLLKDYKDITNTVSFDKNGYYVYTNDNWNPHSDVKTAILTVHKGEQYRVSGRSYYNGNLYVFYGETTKVAFPNASNNNLYTNQTITITEDGQLVFARPNSQASDFKLEKYTFDVVSKNDLPTFDEYYENQELTSINNGYMKIDGTVDTGTGKYVAISVTAGEKYKVYTNHGSNLRSYVLLDSSNNVIAYYPTGSVSTITDVVTVEIQENGTLYVNTFTDKILEVAKKLDIRDIKSNNPIYNKSIMFFGDSITDNRYSWGATFEIRNKNCMTTDKCNYGVSGSQYCVEASSDTSNNINLRVKAYATLGLDYIILSGGANDFSRHNPIGSLTAGYSDALDTSTFYGALEDTIRWLLKNILNCKIGFIITPKARNASDQNNVVTAIKDVCKKYSVPYLDLCEAGNLTSIYDEITTEDYQSISDYLHPNKKGYALINNKVEQFIKSL